MDRFSTAVLFAEGATSQVYRARDPETGSEVALKLLRSDDPELHRRFVLEIKALRKLDHPCIASFVDHGEIDGRPYLAMAFADGIPFDRALAGQPPEVVVRTFLKVADALAHAHDQGLLHRDLKPANVPVHRMAGEFEPMLVDFGLARDVAAPSETATGALLGTPAFMAPEQARGERESVDRRTDVYGLAAVLYAALTGRPPHTGGSAGDVIASILSGPPARPDPRLPKALEAILDRALAQRPADRYPSARQFAADLEAWLNGQSVRALRGFRWRLARRAMVRRKWLTAGVAASVVAVLALGVQQAWLQQQATQQREVAVRLSEELAATREKMRLVHLAPEHDIRAEWAFVEQRIESFRTATQAPGTRRLPGVHYVLGRLLLDTGRFEAALERLERARAMGCDSPACAAALAMAHLQLHRRDLERQLDSIGPGEAVSERHLAAARDAIRGVEVTGPDRVAVAAIVQPLAQLAELGESVLAASPWAYEVPQAVGDARYRAGLEEMRADNLSAAFGHFEVSLTDFARASAIARSFPDAEVGTCRSLARMAEIAGMDHDQALTDIEPALARCARARRIDPDQAAAYTLPAAIHERRAMLAYEQADFEASSRAIQTALDVLAEAPAPARKSVEYAIVEARVLNTSALAEQLVGRASVARLQRALAAAQRATEIDADSIAAWRTWIVVVGNLVNRDPEAGERHAVRAVEVARTIAERWPEDRSARNSLGTMLMNLAYHGRLAGSIDETSLRRAIKILQELVADAPGYARARNNLGMAWWELAVTQLEQGGGFRDAEVRARRQYEHLLKLSPDRPSALINLSSLNLSIADGLVERGIDPGQRLSRSIALLEQVRAMGEYLPCDFALANWLRAKTASASEQQALFQQRAAEHALRGNGADCSRVAEALGLRMASSEAS